MTLARRISALAWAAGLSACNAAVAGDTHSSDSEHWFVPTIAVGLSYPFGASVSGGLALPLNLKGELLPTAPAPRVDVEVGLYGGLVSAGLFVPLGYSGFMHIGVNLKAARMQTWGGPGGNQAFNGGIFELDVAGQEFPPIKIGVGAFTAVNSVGGGGSLAYGFIGFGW